MVAVEVPTDCAAIPESLGAEDVGSSAGGGAMTTAGSESVVNVSSNEVNVFPASSSAITR